METLSRRTALASIGGIVLGTTVASGVTARNAPDSGSSAFVRPGVNQFDGEGDGDLTVNVVAAKDPASGSRRVAHGTSEGERSGDYVTTVRPLDVSLETFADGGTLTYEYYEGPNNTHAAPDEVWLYIRDDDGDYHVVWHAANDNFSTAVVPPDGRWLTRNVHNEILGDPDPEDNPSFYWFELTDDGRKPITSNIGNNNVANLVEAFGKDCELLRIGAGLGSFGGDEVSDVYFRKLRVDGVRRGDFSKSG